MIFLFSEIMFCSQILLLSATYPVFWCVIIYLYNIRQVILIQLDIQGEELWAFLASITVFLYGSHFDSLCE